MKGFAIAVLVLIISFVATVRFFVGFLAERKKAYKELDDNIAEPEEAPARVAAVDSEIVKWGSKTPHHKIIYSAIFDLDNGETKAFESETPVFEGLTVGQIGILIYCGDTFLGFADFENSKTEVETDG